MAQTIARLTEQELNDFSNSVNDLNKAIVNTMPYLYAMLTEQQVILQHWSKPDVSDKGALERLQRDFGVVSDKETHQLDSSDKARVDYVRDRFDDAQITHLLMDTITKSQSEQKEQAVAHAIDAPSRPSAASFIQVAPESFQVARIIEPKGPVYVAPIKTTIVAPTIYEPAEHVSFGPASATSE